MVRDAEAHAADDHRQRELAEARNQGDLLIHRTRKALGEYQEKLGPDEKAKIEAEIGELEAALKGSNREEIDARTRELVTASQELGEKVYADVQSQGSRPRAATSPHGSGPAPL
jgi:molecular chaperone DnaK